MIAVAIVVSIGGAGILITSLMLKQKSLYRSAISTETKELEFRYVYKLAHERDYYHLYHALAGNSNTPKDILKEIGEKGEEVESGNKTWFYILQPHDRSKVIGKLVVNESTPMPVLHHYLNSTEDEFLLAKLASNPSIGSENIEKLARHKSSIVRSGVAENTKTPDVTLRLLSRDQNYYVRRRVAKNHNISTRLQEILSKDEDKWVKLNLLLNPRTDPKIVKMLRSDADPEVSKLARRKAS